MIGLALSAIPQKLLAEVVGVVLEVALVAGVAYHFTAKHYEAVIQQDHDRQAAVAAAAAASAAAETARRVGAQQEIVTDAKRQAETARADAARAHDADTALRLQLAAVLRASRPASDPGPSSGGAPATDAAGVFAELFQRADDRAGILAAALDASRSAGLACERSYDALSQ